MANKKYNSDFDIPTPIIVLAFIFCWPLGIALVVLRSIFKSGTKKNSDESPYRAEDARYKTKGNAKRSSKLSRIGKFTKILSVVFLVAAGLISFSAIADSYSLYNALENFASMALPFFAVAGGLGIASATIERRESRYARIRAIIGDRDSLNLDKLAAASNNSLKKVRKDLQKMIDSGEFGTSAYIDLGTNNFMRTPYAQPDAPLSFDYRSVYGEMLKKDKKNEKHQPVEEVPENTEEKNSDKENFEKIISEIRRLNYEIKDASVSERIDRIESHTKNIFDYVTANPEAMTQIRTFMNYYLPTTLKLLESYSRIERVGVAGENMKKSKENIESILDLLVIGFEQQIDQLFKNESIDISSDISVLETMMQKDGLSGKNDFDIKSYTDSFSNHVSDDLGGGGAAASCEDN